MQRLPIDDILQQVMDALARSSCVVLQAPTGAGKTTRIPPALLQATWCRQGDDNPAQASALPAQVAKKAAKETTGGTSRGTTQGTSQGTLGGQIIVLEPRRIAARAAARRMAAECGESVGQSIGYQVRFDRCASAVTRILVVTEGIFVRMLQDDPFLEGIAAVVFDEFHERSLQNDVALAMTRKIQQEVRDDLRLVVMSATLATDEVAAYLGDCPVVTSEGRSYPVTIQHLDTPDQRPMIEQVASGVRQLQAECRGDLLVFLPGVGEIHRVASLLESWAQRQDVALMSLFGDLTPAEQDAVLLPGPRQKVILSTNVAETSVTIEGVEGVIDAGLARRMRYDAGSGLNRLELVQISQASAEQRAGRAGRMGPGRCLRLWTAAEHQHRPAQEAPELRHVDLASTVLELLAWGESDLRAFPWFEAPTSTAITEALALLLRLGAMAQEGAVTQLGQQMASLPVHPRLSRLILAGLQWDCLEDACLVVALLSERDPFRRGGGGGSHDFHSSSPPVSLWERLHVLKAHRQDPSAGAHLLKAGAARFVWQAQKQLVRLARQWETGQDADAVSGKGKDVERGAGRGSRSAAFEGRRGASRQRDHEESRVMPKMSAEGRLVQACLAAFPDRVARRRDASSHRAVMADGKGVCLADKRVPLPTALCVCLQLDAGRRGEHTEAIIRQMLEIDETQLPQALLDERVEVVFDPGRQQVMALARTYFQALLLQEKVTSLPNAGEVEEVLAQAAAAALEQALDLQAPETTHWLARLHCLGEWMPALDLPVFDREGLKAILPMLCAGRRSFAQLRDAPLIDILQGSLLYQQRQSLDLHAPERLEVPSGSLIRLTYEVGKSPILAVRIQEVFGWADTPKIADGRVPVLLHLLAPNMRPQQITQDLRSFWESTYLEVRKELRQRYPKHAWPEDPWNAPPERRPRRRR